MAEAVIKQLRPQEVALSDMETKKFLDIRTGYDRSNYLCMRSPLDLPRKHGVAVFHWQNPDESACASFDKGLMLETSALETLYVG